MYAVTRGCIDIGYTYLHSFLPSSFFLSILFPPNTHTHTHNTHTDNRPPNITGQLTVRVNVNISLEETYLAEDQDGDDIQTFILQVSIHCK